MGACQGIWDAAHEMGSVKCRQGDKWYSSPCRPGLQVTTTQCHIEGTKVFSDIADHKCSVDFHSACDDCQASWDADHNQVTVKCVVGTDTWDAACSSTMQIVV